jgi:hypothetical protein
VDLSATQQHFVAPTVIWGGNRVKGYMHEVAEAGFRRQIVAWQAIAKNPCLKPVRIGAARRALDWLRQQGVIA